MKTFYGQITDENNFIWWVGKENDKWGAITESAKVFQQHCKEHPAIKFTCKIHELVD